MNLRCQSVSDSRYKVGFVGRANLAFTLIEIMLVVGILALVMAMGAPTFYEAVKRGPMRQVITGVTDAFEIARARAILGGETVKVVFNPQEKSFSVEGGGGTVNRPGSTGSGTIDDSLFVEMLDVNLTEYREQDRAEVRFFSNGTSDEFTLIVRSDENRWVKLSLDPITGMLTVGGVE